MKTFLYICIPLCMYIPHCFVGCFVIILHSVCHETWRMFLIVVVRMMKEFHITGVDSRQICGFRKGSSSLKTNECLQKKNRYFKGIALKFIGGTLHVIFAGQI